MSRAGARLVFWALGVECGREKGSHRSKKAGCFVPLFGLAQTPSYDPGARCPECCRVHSQLRGFAASKLRLMARVRCRSWLAHYPTDSLPQNAPGLTGRLVGTYQRGGGGGRGKLSAGTELPGCVLLELRGRAKMRRLFPSSPCRPNSAPLQGSAHPPTTSLSDAAEEEAPKRTP